MSRKTGEKVRRIGLAVLLSVLFLSAVFGCSGSAEKTDRIDAEASPAPTEIPTTPAPTEIPATPAPTEIPATPAPTEVPATSVPTEVPVTLAPSEAPAISAATEAPTIPEDSTFEIYYLDVGQGDGACVICDGHAMMIDGGNKSYSSFIYSFLHTHGIEHLDYIVATHPDADHIGGLSGALNAVTVGKAFCTVQQYDTETFHDFVKYLRRQKQEITFPHAGERFSLGSASFTILYPDAGESRGSNTSLVIRIEYGETSFLFSGIPPRTTNRRCCLRKSI